MKYITNTTNTKRWNIWMQFQWIDDCSNYLYMTIPFRTELFADEVWWKLQRSFTNQTSLFKTPRMKEMNLTMRKARFHSFLQQLHHILKENKKWDTHWRNSSVQWQCNNHIRLLIQNNTILWSIPHFLAIAWKCLL